MSEGKEYMLTADCREMMTKAKQETDKIKETVDKIYEVGSKPTNKILDLLEEQKMKTDKLMGSMYGVESGGDVEHLGVIHVLREIRQNNMKVNSVYRKLGQTAFQVCVVLLTAWLLIRFGLK